MSLLGRTSGILLHPTSLPGRYGVGDLGPDAYRFADWLARTGQGLWQMLPLGPTGYGNSPYMCFSAFGGNPLLISPDGLVEAGWLTPDELANPPGFPAGRVDYGAAWAYKGPLLQRAFHRFQERGRQGYPERFYRFCQEHAEWLEDYALFMALKDAQRGAVWNRWPEPLAHRDPDALLQARRAHGQAILFRKFVQFVFFEQWHALRDYCHRQGIRLVGDLPIFVAYDSADVWAHRELFHLDEDGRPLAVAGVPPDYFSATGQRWGNPLYRWEAVARTGFCWWVQRVRVTLSLVDVVRLDHFRGFEAYWEVPAEEPNAVNGEWVKGPGRDLFDAIKRELGEVPMIAEDLGVITPEVDALREQLRIPGMRILQMAFGTDPKAPEYRPHRHVRDCVVYTATHDHNTSAGWYSAEPGTQTTQTVEEVAAERDLARRYLPIHEGEVHWDFIRAALGSVADTAVIPMQDILGLDTASRMNLPGTSAGNWEWRLAWEQVVPEAGERLYDLTRLFDRTSAPV